MGRDQVLEVRLLGKFDMWCHVCGPMQGSSELSSEELDMNPIHWAGSRVNSFRLLLPFHHKATLKTCVRPGQTRALDQKAQIVESSYCMPYCVAPVGMVF